MPRAYVAVTDWEWYEFLSNRPELTEVNFWQPGGRSTFKALSRGELFLFKLHAPNNFIVGGGFFETASILPLSIAWETFGSMNGVASLSEMRRRIDRFRRRAPDPAEDYAIGNIVLQQAFFFHREAWIAIPTDFSLNTVQGKGYDLSTGEGLRLAKAVEERLLVGAAVSSQAAVAEGQASKMFSDPAFARRRLGQGGFRIRVTDNYSRHCAVTKEHTLPVLQAAHIRPITQGGEHSDDNGLFLRSDVHTLFDRGYVTITPDFRFQVSKRLKEEWNNGKAYYDLANRPISLPADPACYPNRDILKWHADTIFRK